MIIKTKPLDQYPDIEQIKDKLLKDFNQGLAELLTSTVRNIYDDIVLLEKAERVTTLPTASLANRGKFVLLETTGAAADGLYICVDTGSGGYAFKKVTVA